MNLRDIFSNKGTTSAPAATPPAPKGTNTASGTPGNIPEPGVTGMTADPNNPTVPLHTTPAPTPPQSPLDKFGNLWDTKPSETVATNEFNVDPQKLMEVAGKIDFTKIIPAETLTAIATGGEAAQKAFAQSMNQVAQTVYAQSAVATTKIVEHAMDRLESKFQDALPGLIKKQQLSESMRESNPAMNHPAAQPIVAALEVALTNKYPTASVNEIKQLAGEYLTTFASAFGAKAADAKDIKKSEVNWENFFQ